MALATPEDVEARLGRDLTEGETTTAEFLIDALTGTIADLLGQDPDDWSPDPVPSLLKLLVVEKVVSVVTNPEGFETVTEQLGAYQHTGTRPRAGDIGVFLSDDEQRRVRRIWGRTFKSVTQASPYSGEDRSELDFDLPLP